MAKNCGKQAPPLSHAARPAAFYHLHDLLHTVRSISQHEDDLCCLLHELDHPGALPPEVSLDLQSLLTQMAAANYEADLSAVWRSLSIMPPQRSVKTKSTRAKARKKPRPLRKAKAKKSTRSAAKHTPRTRAA